MEEEPSAMDVEPLLTVEEEAERSFLVGRSDLYFIPQNMYAKNQWLQTVDLSFATEVRMGRRCFRDCSHLRRVYLSYVDVSEGAFTLCCQLQSVHFKGMEKKRVHIGEHAFACCSALVMVEDLPEEYTLGEGAFAGCGSLHGEFVVGGEIQPVLPSSIFQFCQKVRKITIRDGTLSIGAKMCMRCHLLTAITVPRTVVTLFSQAFAQCTSLITVLCEGPALRDVHPEVFYGCVKLQHISFHPESNIGFWEGVFEYCTALTVFQVPQQTRVLSENMFRNCRWLREIHWAPHMVLHTIGKHCFMGCEVLKKLDFTGLTNLKKIGDGALMETGLRMVDLRKTSVHTIGQHAFFGMHSLNVLHLPPQLKSAGMGMCKRCSSLKQIVFPSTLTKIPDGCFVYCTNLRKVHIKAAGVPAASGVFKGCDHLNYVVWRDEDGHVRATPRWPVV